MTGTSHREKDQQEWSKARCMLNTFVPPKMLARRCWTWRAISVSCLQQFMCLNRREC